MEYARYDDLGHLKLELEQERRYRETIEWSNTELERSITELEAYLRELEGNSRGADDNEWRVRFESQTALNKQLQEQKDWLDAELAESRRRLTTGSYPEAMNFNLDALNEPELLRLVKHLERMRNDYYSSLRDTEWKLDKESKEFHHFDEMRRVYKMDLKHANHTVERMRLGHVLDPSGAVSPIYPPGYFRWLDSHTPINYPRSDGGNGNGGKKNQKKGGGGGGGSQGQSKNQGGKLEEHQMSPTRSKSRAEKKSKKKDVPPPAEPVNNRGHSRDRGGRKGSSLVMNVSETETGNGTDASAPDQDPRDKPSSNGDNTFTISITKEEPKLKREGSKDRLQEDDD